MSNTIFDFEVRSECKTLTPEEIAATYGERAIRPIPPGYTKKRGAFSRMGINSVKPYRVYRVGEDGHRTFVSSHASLDLADNAANKLNADCGKSGPRFVSGEFQYAKGFVCHEKTED
jgi:hypothetical protein